MNRSRIEAVLRDIDVSTFPIPVTLGVSNCGTKVSASLRAPDANNPEAKGINWPPHVAGIIGDSERAVVEAALVAISDALNHEVDEHFKFRGVLFTDPHPVQK